MSEIPNAIEAERSILGAMLINTLLPFETDLTADDFYLTPHQHIFGAICETVENGDEVTPIHLSELLKIRHPLSDSLELFSVSSLMALATGIPYGTKFNREIKLLKEKTTRRRLMQLGDSLQRRAMSVDENNADLISDVVNLLDALQTEAKTKTDGFRALSEIAKEAEIKYQQLASGVNFNIPTGIGEIDRITRGGVAPGDVWVIGAFTGNGKSALALQMARNQAERNITVGIISREMQDFENFERLHSAKSNTPLWLIKPEMDSTVLEHLQNTLPQVAALPIFIDSTTGDIERIRQKIKRLVEKQGAKVVYVDYLQLLEVEGAGKRWSRAQEVEKCSRTLKSIAMDLQIGIVALAQYNRLANYAGKAETHHFADSSAIEKDASVVLHLELEQVEAGAEIPKWRKATIRPGKARQSPLVPVTLWFRGECFTFSDKDYSSIAFSRSDYSDSAVN